VWKYLVLALLGAVAAASCASSSPSATPGVVRVVAAENFWGSIASQIGGAHARVTSIIHDPTADPHLYESDAQDANAVANAQLVIENGLGYDDFMDQLLSASSSHGRQVLTVADVLRVSGHDADPHLWYDVPRAHEVAAAIAARLTAADPADRAFFASNLASFDASMTRVLAVVHTIEQKYANAPVVYTERVPAYLVAACGLSDKTPPGYARAIEDGNEPSPADTQAMQQALSGSARARVLLYNVQATSPATQQMRDLAARSGVRVVSVSETMPAGQTFASWQTLQAEQILRALGS
jgi:zinc/manganese transport system substrate-binding protein